MQPEKMKRFVFISAITAALALSPDAAAYPRVKNIYKSVYGAGAQNWDFAQTDGGCIYIANNIGMVEYDGNRWDNYYMPNGTTVRSLLYTAENRRLYAGAYDEFGYFEPGPDGRLRYTSMKPLFEGETGDAAESSTMTEFWNIHRIGSTLYFRTDWAIFKYTEHGGADESAGGRETTSTNSGGRADVMQFPGNRIDCSAVVRNCLLVSTGKDGPMTLSGDMFVPLPGAGRLAGKTVCAILPYGENMILFATDIHGLWLFDGSDIVRYGTRFDEALKEDQLWCADIDGSTLALGTIRGGVYVIDLSDGSGTRCDRSAGLQNNTVLSLFFDADSNLWLGLDNGISYLMLDRPDQPIFTGEESSGAGYSSLVYGGNLYLGTNQGLFYTGYTPGATEFGRFEAVKSGGAVAQVWRLAEIGGALFCSHDRGLLIIQNGRVSNISEMLGVWKVLPVGKGDDTILGSSYRGLFILKKSGGVWALSHLVEGWDESSGMLVEDPDGRIWFSHWQKGLFRLTLDAGMGRVTRSEYFGTGKGFPTERNNTPYRVGSGIVFASEGGFYLYDRVQDRMVRESTLNELFADRSPVSMRIHDLGQGDLLFVSGAFCGLAVGGDGGSYTLDSLSMRHIADELIIGFDNHTMLDRNLLLMSKEDGFSLVDLEHIKNSSTVRSGNAVFVKAMWSTGSGETLVYGEREARAEGLGHAPLKIPYRDNSLRIEASAPEYRDAGAVEYSFMLDGYDHEWSSYSTYDTKEYTRLAEGNYTLHVRARNNFTQSVSTTEMSFSISPPWYRSYVAIVFYFFCVLTAIWWLTRQINRRSNRRVNEVKKQKEREMREQQHLYEEAVKEKENELVMLQNEALRQEVKGKSQELASSTMNIIRKNEILMRIEESIGKAIPNVSAGDPWRGVSMLRRVQKDIRENIAHDSDWEKFEHNFDIVHENYLRRLGEDFPGLNLNDKRLCAYLRMDLQSKDIAPLLNISVRSVEMARYRLRKKMGLGREVNLSEFLQNF